MATARDIIDSSLRLIGALAAGESSDSSDADNALAVLNQFIESLANERLMLPETSRDTYTLTASTNPHTLGSGGTITGDRPVRIVQAGLIQSGQDEEYPIEIVDHYRWASIHDKTLEDTIPDLLWVEAEPTTVKLWLWPICSEASTLVLYTWKALVSSLALGTTLAYPPGYEQMLRYNLAVLLAPEYGRALPPEVARIARESKQAIKRANRITPALRLDSAINPYGGHWDIKTGDYR